MMIDSERPVIEFTAGARCDRCGAQAYYGATSDKGFELLFCVHHMRDNRAKLIDDGWTIVSDKEALERMYEDLTDPLTV